MAEPPVTSGTVHSLLTNVASGVTAVKDALSETSLSDKEKTPLVNAFNKADQKINEALLSIADAQVSAIAEASETITTDFLKSSYEEAGQLERYYGTTRIAASTFLLTIASGIGVALLSTIHTLEPERYAKTIEWLRLGSFAIPIGIFFIMFYVNLYFEYWGNVANRVARYVEQLQILRMQSQEDFIEIWNREDGRLAAAVRSVNRAQSARPISMIAYSLAAVAILVEWIARAADEQLFTGAKASRDYVFWVASLAIVVLGGIAVRLAWKILWSKNLWSKKPNISIANIKSYADRHRTKFAAGNVGRINVFEANFVFVFLAAALYIAAAIGVNKIPLTPPKAASTTSVPVPPTPPPPGGGSIVDRPVPGGQQTPPVPAQSSTGPTALPPGTPEAQFQFALNLARRTVRNRDLSDRAVIVLHKVVMANPQHAQVGEVQYWMGEIFFAREDWDRAMREFATHIQIHRQHVRTMESLLRLGQSLGKLGRRGAACDTFTEFEQRFPDMPPANKDILLSERDALQCPR